MKQAGPAGLLALMVTVAALGVAVPAGALEVGDKAPVFTLPATTQEKFSLTDVVGKKNIVLFGFIGAFTPT